MDLATGAVGGGKGGPGEQGEESVNGEIVERDVRALQMREGRRAVVAGVGFMLGVVGLWGDGAVPVAYGGGR